MEDLDIQPGLDIASEVDVDEGKAKMYEHVVTEACILDWSTAVGLKHQNCLAILKLAKL